MNRIDKKFLELKRKKKKALIIYLTVGFPDMLTTEKLFSELDKIGVDIFELGMPFSDPLADGPIIQESSEYALKHNINLDNVFSLTKRLRKKIDKPLLMMGYFNPILQYGFKRFSQSARACGLDGVIIPDLPIEEAKELKGSLGENRIHLINFVAPTTDLLRIRKIAGSSGGFIYYVSLTGVTGARKKLPYDIQNKIRDLKKFTKTPVCVGFGISNRKQFKSVTSFSDGAIIGSAIIKKISENLNRKDLINKVVNFVKSLNP